MYSDVRSASNAAATTTTSAPAAPATAMCADHAVLAAWWIAPSVYLAVWARATYILRVLDQIRAGNPSEQLILGMPGALLVRSTPHVQSGPCC
jgi:hypothetical protein